MHPQDGKQIRSHDRQTAQGQEDQSGGEVIRIPDVSLGNHCKANDVDDCIEQENACIRQADSEVQFRLLEDKDPAAPALCILWAAC